MANITTTGFATEAEEINTIAAYNADAASLTDLKGAALYVGSSGNLKVTMAGGGTVTFKNIPDGTFLPIAAKHVQHATATTDDTASDIIAIS